MSKPIVGIMGPGEGAKPDENEIAFELGKAVAAEGWVVLTGGRGFCCSGNPKKRSSNGKNC